jgi:outer membrane murein-binding lipoprotein Lpp
MKTIRKNKIAALLLAAVMVAGCATISLFDQHAYERTTALKVDALHVMSAATEDYAAHEQDIETLQLNLQKAYEYEKNRPNNEVTTQMWVLLLNPDEHLLGGFFTLWKEEGKLSETAITRAKQQVGEAFDKIAGLESRKIKK